DAHALEQVVDQPAEPQRAALERRDELKRILGRVVAERLLQELDRRGLRGERGLELVRDVGEHRVARAPRGLELGLVAQQLDLAAAAGGRARDHDRAAAAREVEVLDRARAAARARVHDRARVLARAAAAR